MPLPTQRKCTVEIQNKSSSLMLCEPLVYVFKGNCESPLPPTLRPTESGSALFIKKVYTTSGSSGIFTYDIVHESSKECKGRLAVMFAVPYDFNIFYNWYAVGIFSKDKQCNDDLYNEMYYGVQDRFIRGKAKGPSLTHKEGEVTIRASMSDSFKPILKLELCDN
ncbi:DELTA-sagatoxin-Srs1a-like [Xiphophorus couchianus]|uniref:DELTA-sagatoxin-Srs1a n=1 Tax=Xiphophorus couchianus TaxID=32473 RepID=A0A3B5ML96_9TELE|nr:DELTA-sagatoxin-Srs1a-like [Xiphophorus couchianus]